jgi:hypothetical protein
MELRLILHFPGFLASIHPSGRNSRIPTWNGHRRDVPQQTTARRENMFNRKCVCVAAALAVCAVLCVSSAEAEEPSCYTSASVEGSWAIVGTYGANVAIALARRTIAEDGDFTGTFLVNGPTAGSTNGARTITTGTQVGTYSINCDGTGTVTRTLTASNGVVTTQVDDLVITKAVREQGRLIATAFTDAQRTPSALVPGGIFLTRVHTRLPNDERRER